MATLRFRRGGGGNTWDPSALAERSPVRPSRDSFPHVSTRRSSRVLGWLAIAGLGAASVLSGCGGRSDADYDDFFYDPGSDDGVGGSSFAGTGAQPSTGGSGRGGRSGGRGDGARPGSGGGPRAGAGGVGSGGAPQPGGSGGVGGLAGQGGAFPQGGLGGFAGAGGGLAGFGGSAGASAGQGGVAGHGGLAGQGGGGVAGQGGFTSTPTACVGCVFSHCPATQKCLTTSSCVGGLVCGATNCLTSGSSGEVTCWLGCFEGNLQSALVAYEALSCVVESCGVQCASALGN